MSTIQPITLGIGNGSLGSSVCWILSQCGINCDPTSRTAWQETGNKLVNKIFISRPQNLPQALDAQQVDAVIVGLDMLTEWSFENDYHVREMNEYKQSNAYQTLTDHKELCKQLQKDKTFFRDHFNDFIIINNARVSKTSLQKNARVVAFVHQDSPYTCKNDLADSRIYSEYPQITKRWIGNATVTKVHSEHHMTCESLNHLVEIIESYGGTEGMVATGVFDCGVGVTDTGASLAANNLRILETIMEAPVVMAVRPEDIDDERLQHLAVILNGVHAAQNYVLLKMNVEKNRLPSIIPLLPALKSPTIHQLNETDNVAVETVVQKNSLAALLVDLKIAGASGFIWHELNGVVS